MYVNRTVQAFLAVREHYQEIMNLVGLMYHSGYACFKVRSMQRLQDRFKID